VRILLAVADTCCCAPGPPREEALDDWEDRSPIPAELSLDDRAAPDTEPGGALKPPRRTRTCIGCPARRILRRHTDFGVPMSFRFTYSIEVALVILCGLLQRTSSSGSGRSRVRCDQGCKAASTRTVTSHVGHGGIIGRRGGVHFLFVISVMTSPGSRILSAGPPGAVPSTTTAPCVSFTTFTPSPECRSPSAMVGCRSALACYGLQVNQNPFCFSGQARPDCPELQACMQHPQDGLSRCDKPAAGGARRYGPSCRSCGCSRNPRVSASKSSGPPLTFVEKRRSRQALQPHRLGASLATRSALMAAVDREKSIHEAPFPQRTPCPRHWY